MFRVIQQDLYSFLRPLLDIAGQLVRASIKDIDRVIVTERRRSGRGVIGN
jgi:hypothetical protein